MFGSVTELINNISNFMEVFDRYPTKLAEWQLNEVVTMNYVDLDDRVVMTGCFGSKSSTSKAPILKTKSKLKAPHKKTKASAKIDPVRCRSTPVAALTDQFHDITLKQEAELEEEAPDVILSQATLDSFMCIKEE